MLVLVLPWFSLLLSLPAMWSCKVRIACPGAVMRKQQVTVAYTGETVLPVPAIRGKLMAVETYTGKKRTLESGGVLPTEHCGALEILPKRLWVYDYLGLFRIPMRNKSGCKILIRPEKVPVENPPDLNRYLANSWRPKPGGGYAENHELRLYRPGDNLKQIHWKLSAKTGKLVLREPMEALRGAAMLTMVLRGSAEELDNKLGQLYWMSEYLLRKEIPHSIQCLTGSGMVCFPVSCPEDTGRCIDALLGAEPAKPEKIPQYRTACWRYHIGGDDHEA